MKKLSITAMLLLFLVSCGEKKAEDSFGKPAAAEESEVVVEEELQVEDATAALVSQGKEIFEGKGTCVACHQPSTKTVGPSIQEIAQIYKEKNADLVVFLKGEGEPIVDPSQYEIMKANFAITKAMSDEELNSVEAYIQSYLK